MLIQKRFLQHTNTKQWFWVLTIVTSLLVGLGIGQMVRFQEATAESQEEVLPQLTAELDALKAEHEKIQAKWQSELLAQIVPTLTDESDAVKRQFVDFLEEIGSPGMAALAVMIRDPAKSVRKKAADTLGGIGERERKAGRNYDAAAIGLAMALKDDSNDVFREAVAELDDVRPTSAESLAVVVPALIAVQTKGSSSTRNDVLDILGQIGEYLAENGQSTDIIRDALIMGLNDNSTKVRTNAITELSDIRAASAETFTALIGALSDDAKSVRARAEDVLIKLGRSHAVSITPLLASTLTNNQSATTRGHVVDVLGEIGEALVKRGESDEMVVKPLLVALQDSVADVRRNAADELGEMRAKSPAAVTALTQALEDSSKNVRSAAQKAIRRIEAAK
ncbi:MAG: HEAT repeat domain-containing protein [Candidatus Poribacteria bacterium]|nr:HEAT repeat domain-containing protein [Candidatus Poribacteria bacterium]